MLLATKPAALQSEMPEIHVQEENLAVSFDVQFWGVRGQIATPGKDSIRYGGNTSCVEIRTDDTRLIFDGGTGLRQLGNSLLKQMPIEAHMFFTHCHWDRIQGFPFFVPAFIPINHFHIYGAAASNGSTFQDRLREQMLGPNFPVPMQVMQSKMEFYDLTTEEQHCLGEVAVKALVLNDSHRSVGYRIDYRGRSVVYATGTHSPCDRLQENLLKLAHRADLVILDAPGCSSDAIDSSMNSAIAQWEETIWQQSILTAKAADAKQVVMSLHNPDHDDDFLDCVDKKIQSIFPNALLAREGMVFSIH